MGLTYTDFFLSYGLFFRQFFNNKHLKYFIALKFRGIKISRFRGQAQKTAKLKCREKCISTSTAKLKCREKIVFVANREI